MRQARPGEHKVDGCYIQGYHVSLMAGVKRMIIVGWSGHVLLSAVCLCQLEPPPLSKL